MISYLLKTRSETQVDLVETRTHTIASFRDKEMARKFLDFMIEEALEEDDDDQILAEFDDECELHSEVVEKPVEIDPSVPVSKPRTALVPAEKPVAPVTWKPGQADPLVLASAFERLDAGEKVAEVAQAIGIPFASLRAHWGLERRRRQKHIAMSGQQPCSLCQKPFTPSLSHPDTCARCSRG